MSIRDTLIQKVTEAGGKLRVRSALNPVLWMCAIVTVPCVIIAALYKPPPPSWLIGIACAPVVAAFIGFIFLLLFDRDKLQSEDYQIRKRSLELIQEKGDAIPIAATSIEAISNPQRPQLPSASHAEEE